MEYTKSIIKTKNIPLLDELIHGLKKLMISAVVKDDADALNAETIESRKAGGLYILCKSNRASFGLFEYSREDLLDVALPESMIPSYLKEPNKIPSETKNKLLAKKTIEYIESYEEKNNYYRMLNGYPNVGEAYLYTNSYSLPTNLSFVTDSFIYGDIEDNYIPIENIYQYVSKNELSNTILDYRSINDIKSVEGLIVKVSLTRLLNKTSLTVEDLLKVIPADRLLQIIKLEDIVNNIPIHLYSNDMQDIFDSQGLFDQLRKDYPEKKYLNYLGSKRIDIYTARIAPQFGLLYTTPDAHNEIVNRFKDKYEVNRVYTLNAIYSDAWKIDNDHYDKVMQIFIIIQTMIDVLAELPDMIIKREVFDLRSIKLLFESHGVTYFSGIPYRYQLAMVRNLHTLIKYKATTKNIVDICSLFGFDDIVVFKYYLLKQRNLGDNNEFISKAKLTYDEETEEELSKRYTLKFIKVPIDDIADNYLHNTDNHIDYDIITFGDKYWDGGEPHEDIKMQILKKKFNYQRSKYISIDAINNMTQLTFEMCYFYNIIFDDVFLENYITLRVPTINPNAVFKFNDLLCYLFALTYISMGIKDDIKDTATKIMYIHGFNFEADIDALLTYIEEQGYDEIAKYLGENFKIPATGLISFNQLIDLFNSNKGVYDWVVENMRTADNKYIYDIFEKIYNSLMIIDLNYKFFSDKDGNIYESYTDYIASRDHILYQSIMDIKNIDNEIERQDTISNIINYTIYALEEYFNGENFKYLYYFMPGVGIEAIKQYVYRVINFFKSYKLQIYSIGTIYEFDDKLDNWIKVIDKLHIDYKHYRRDDILVVDKLCTILIPYFSEHNLVRDHVSIYIDQLINSYLHEEMNIKEFLSMLIKYEIDDYVEIDDLITIVKPYIENNKMIYGWKNTYSGRFRSIEFETIEGDMTITSSTLDSSTSQSITLNLPANQKVRYDNNKVILTTDIFKIDELDKYEWHLDTRNLYNLYQFSTAIPLLELPKLEDGFDSIVCDGYELFEGSMASVTVPSLAIAIIDDNLDIRFICNKDNMPDFLKLMRDTNISVRIFDTYDIDITNTKEGRDLARLSTYNKGTLLTVSPVVDMNVTVKFGWR